MKVGSMSSETVQNKLKTQISSLFDMIDEALVEKMEKDINQYCEDPSYLVLQNQIKDCGGELDETKTKNREADHMRIEQKINNREFTWIAKR